MADVKEARPWHQVSPYAGVKDDPNELVIIKGRVYRGVNKTLTAAAIEQIKDGVRCIMCEEPQLKGPWPKTCALCGFPIAKEQARLFEKTFKGEEWVGTTIDFGKELDRLDAELEEDNWKERPTRGVVLPRAIKENS